MTALQFTHVYEQGAGANARTLLLLHGTGGNERDLLGVGRSLDPAANLLSPRGKVLERGMPRFFRRLAEGVFDTEDLIARTHELAEFVRSASGTYGFLPEKVVAVGFSNGANIGGALLLLRPEVLRAAALWRPMIPLVPEKPADLQGRDVLLTHGSFDSMTDEPQRERYARMLREAGARVEVETLTAGHVLSANDISITEKWLRNRVQE
ncbi:MAG TPA: alpha/beta hydrolase [Phycisphaerae bacterium]|nr:alpha/beta hydrolase [Phycisphaerae bacterium]